MEEWDGQSPPTARTQKGKPVVNLQSVIGAEKSLPNFGPYARERAALKAEMKKSQDLLDDVPAPNRPANKPAAMTPTVEEVIGRALDKIGTYNDLDNKQHVIALIDPEMCINCGELPHLSPFILH